MEKTKFRKVLHFKDSSVFAWPTVTPFCFLSSMDAFVCEVSF